MLFIQIISIIFLFIILYCLGSGLYHLIREGGRNSSNVVRALTWRIILSVFLFAFLILAYFLGWIHPHGVMAQ